LRRVTSGMQKESAKEFEKGGLGANFKRGNSLALRKVCRLQPGKDHLSVREGKTSPSISSKPWPKHTQLHTGGGGKKDAPNGRGKCALKCAEGNK